MHRYAQLVRAGISQFHPEIELSLINISNQGKTSSFRSMQRFQIARSLIISLKKLSLRGDADVFHVLDSSFLYLANAVPMERTVVAVHDLIPLLQTRGELGTVRPGFAARRLLALNLAKLKKANFVYTVSQSTAADLARIGGRKADAVINNPVVEASDETASDFSPVNHRRFILHIGNNGFYKNREGVLDIFKRVSDVMPNARLVMAGTAPDDRLRKHLQTLNLSSKVEFIVNPSDDVLQALYSNASCLVFPSLYEGFGWPPLEAAQFGCPVVCANTGSLPEVVGQGGIIHSPQDLDGFAVSVIRILEDTAFSEALIKRGKANLNRFSLQDFANRLRVAYSAAQQKYEASRLLLS